MIFGLHFDIETLFEFRLNLGEYYFDHKTFSKGILCVQSNFLVIVEAALYEKLKSCWQ